LNGTVNPAASAYEGSNPSRRTKNPGLPGFLRAGVRLGSEREGFEDLASTGLRLCDKLSARCTETVSFEKCNHGPSRRTNENPVRGLFISGALSAIL
jgi:hypothetical protein